MTACESHEIKQKDQGLNEHDRFSTIVEDSYVKGREDDQQVYWMSQKYKDNCWADKVRPNADYEYLTDIELN